MKSTQVFTIVIKCFLSVLFFLCLFDMPYGYYQVVRFIGMLGFFLFAYYASEEKRNTEVIVYISLAILFQPLFKISLGRQIWNIVDVIIGACLILSVFKTISNSYAQKK